MVPPIRVFLALVFILACGRPAWSDCAAPPVDVRSQWGIDQPILLTWTNVGGLIFPEVFRGETDSFTSAVRVAQLSLGSTSYEEFPPQQDIVYHYWVRAIDIACGLEPSPPSAAVTASNIDSGTGAIPEPTVTPTCTGIQVTWPTYRSASGVTVRRAGWGTLGVLPPLAPLPGAASTYLDTDILPGATYQYSITVVTPATGSLGRTSLKSFPVVGRSRFGGIPVSAAGVVGGAATLSVVGSPGVGIASPAPVSYLWMRGGAALTPGGPYSGINTPQLLISPLRTALEGEYTLRVSNGCQTVDYRAVLSVTAACRADFNESGALGTQDLFDYLAAFFAACP